MGSHDYNKDAFHLKSHIITMVLYKHHKYLVFQSLTNIMLWLFHKETRLTGSVNHIVLKILKIHFIQLASNFLLTFNFGVFFV